MFITEIAPTAPSSRPQYGVSVWRLADMHLLPSALFVKNLRSVYQQAVLQFNPTPANLWMKFWESNVILTKMHSYNVTPEELFDLFGKFGPVR